MDIDLHIKELKDKLVKDHNIYSDRDLVEKLGIKKEDKDKLYLWIQYQGAYQFRDGYKRGQEILRDRMTDIIDNVGDPKYY